MIPFWKKTGKHSKPPSAQKRRQNAKPAVPRTAQQSIPMQRMFEDGTCRVKANYYTRTIQYQDINYQLAQQEDKTAIFEEWCSFLNFFDSSIKFELSFVNMATDSTEFEKSIRIPFQKDGFDDVRAEYSQMLRQQLAKGNNGLTKTKFITFGVEGESMAQVKPRLDHIQNDLLNNFHRLGVQAKPLNGVQRLKLMHDMASIKLIEPKKKPRYYQITANVLVNGKIERRYGRFDFDPTELKNARARNAAANAAAAEFERQEQEKADKEASNAGKTFAVVAQEYIASNRSRMAPSVRLKGDYDANRNKENTSLKKEKYLQRIQSYPEFSEKAIGTITRQDCDAVIRFLEDSDARVYKRAVLKPESKEFKTVSCPKIAKNCTIREETIERIFRGETVSLDSAQQVAMALGKAVEQMFEVEIDRRPMTKKTMREYNLFIRSVLNYANDNYGTSLQMPMIKASGRKGKSVDCLHSDEVEALQAALKECSMLEKAIVLCLLNTGVRRGELAGLTWKDVNFRDGTIHVSKSLLVFPNYGYQLTTTKESNIRDVDVAPEFMAFLKDYHEQWKSRKKLMGASWQKNLEKKGAKYAQSLLDLRGNDFVICNDYGFPINPDSYAALVRRVGKKAGIEKIHPHMFRHTFVSILLSNPNIGVATVAAEAGHAQPSTTLAIYTQVYDRRRDEIRKQMSKELYK